MHHRESKMSHIDNLNHENSEFRKSKVDPILILEHRRTVLARFWTPQTCLRQPSTTPETKMTILKFRYFRS